jgi:hypothetical protein
MTEACYNLAFFLREFLKQQHGIEVEMVVGWINDGEWAGAASHAWLEFEGKKIDISLNRTSRPLDQPSGNLVILDYIFRNGSATYTYARELSAEADATLKEMAQLDSQLKTVIDHKWREHVRISHLSQVAGGANIYFSAAPPGCTFADLSAAISK